MNDYAATHEAARQDWLAATRPSDIVAALWRMRDAATTAIEAQPGSQLWRDRLACVRQALSAHKADGWNVGRPEGAARG